MQEVNNTSALEEQLYYIGECKKFLEKKTKEIGRPLYACVHTFGCQMNARDSEKLLGVLKEIGYLETEDEDKSDFVIYNTCTVRENANLKVYGRLGHLKNVKRKNPHMLIAMCGCMMQEPDVVEKIRDSYKFVDIVFGTFNIYAMAKLIYNRITSGSQVIDIWEKTKDIVEELPTERKFPFKSGVNIMYGCNNFCTYCIVPYVRGREISREPKDIIMEIERLVKDGVKEVMLLGQNVDSYGKTLDNPVSFAQLLREIDKIEGLERIRFMTPHPKDIEEETLEVIRDSKKICNHIHFPLQSGSSRLLKLMNRKYTKEHYLEQVEMIRRILPDVSITTDIIVGFPTETNEDFNETLSVLKEVEYDMIFSFIYSKRVGTPAAKMPDVLTDEEKHRNFDEMLKVQNEISKRKNETYAGTVQKVLVEGLSKTNDKTLTGRTEGGKVVNFSCSDNNDLSLSDYVGKIVDVKITSVQTWSLFGETEN